MVMWAALSRSIWTSRDAAGGGAEQNYKLQLIEATLFGDTVVIVISPHSLALMTILCF